MRKICRVASLSTILYALFLLYMLTIPLVELNGIVTGYVSLICYHLTYYGNTITLSSLDAVKTISLLITIESIFLLLVGTYTMLCRNQHLVWELLLSALLVALMYAPIPFALLRIIDVETANLVTNNVQYTSAGRINFGTTTITTLRLPTIQLAYIVASVLYSLVASTITIYLARKHSGK